MKRTRPLLKRLPIYLSYLKNYSNERISSRILAEALGLGEILVRKDLAEVSNGGQRKLGHYRNRLIADIEQFLDFNHAADGVLMGAGKLGQPGLVCSVLEESV